MDFFWIFEIFKSWINLNSIKDNIVEFDGSI